ncbi:sensor histidine kinase [Flindersiella endophytica]
MIARIRRLSVRARLLVLTVGLLGVGLLVSGGVVGTLLHGYLIGRIDDQLEPLAQVLTNAPVEQMATGPDAMTEENVSRALEFLGSRYIAYVGADGTVRHQLRAEPVAANDVPELDGLTRSAVEARGGAGFDVRAKNGSARWRVFAMPHATSDGSVVVAASLAGIDATIGRLRAITLGTGLVLLAVLAVAGWYAVRAGLAPLRRIEQTAADIASGDLSHRVPELAGPNTEVGRLSASLNTMLSQLEQAFTARAESEARMRRFVSDVSHELRTPLFGIKGFSQLYRMGALPERADVELSMSRIEAESARLVELVEDLLLLAQLDESAVVVEPTPMDLRTLASDARHDLRALDPTRPVTLTGPGGDGPAGPAPVNGDEARLRRVVSNLLGNAIAHTPPGTPVRIGVGTLDGSSVFEIADEGPGLSQQQAGRAFDRFYRADSSRNRAEGGGAGLGLAIVQSLVTAHSGRVELETAVGEGARFRIVLPRFDGAAGDGA